MAAIIIVQSPRTISISLYLLIMSAILEPDYLVYQNIENSTAKINQYALFVLF